MHLRPGSQTFNSWKNYYLRIRRCNRFLKFVDNAYFADEKERSRMKAEVRVWRAWHQHVRLHCVWPMATQ
ncbi:MAG: RagB/SusD family nutrient uptake outer membrane protein [Parabacteroides sp.]